MLKIAVESYKAANRSIFLQDNRVASGFNAALSALEKKGESGHPSPGGKVLATIGRFIFPVTRVPVNIAAETLQYVGGSVSGSVRAINAIRKGLDTLTPDQADLIMRELKKGSVGMAALLLGYMAYQSVGGVYEQGKKPKPGDIKPDAARLFGVDIPANLLHHPILNTIQLGATVHKTAEEKLRKGDPAPQGVTAGLLAASWGLADEVPFIQGPHRLFGGLANPYTREKTIGNEVGSIVIPQAVAWLAQVLDQRRETPPAGIYDRITGPPAKLDPQGVLQTIETRIPGLRQNIPEKGVGSGSSAPTGSYRADSLPTEPGGSGTGGSGRISRLAGLSGAGSGGGVPRRLTLGGRLGGAGRRQGYVSGRLRARTGRIRRVRLTSGRRKRRLSLKRSAA